MLTATALILSEPLIKDAMLSKEPPPLASDLGCEEARPNIFPVLSAPTYSEEQGNSAAFMPIEADANPVSAPFRCNQQRENP